MTLVHTREPVTVERTPKHTERGARSVRHGFAIPLAPRLLAFVILWSTVWAVHLRVRPDWLVASSSGAQSLLQAIPAAVIALVVLLVASIYVIAQQVSTLYSSRAPLILLSDPGVVSAVGKTVLVAVAALMVGGQIPDAPAGPTEPLLALISTLTLATVILIPQSAIYLRRTLAAYSSPRNFMLQVVGFTKVQFRKGLIDRVGLTTLGEMMRLSVRRGETTPLTVAVEGIQHIQNEYIASAEANPSLRLHAAEAGPGVDVGWWGAECRDIIVRAAQEALRSGTSESDIDKVESLPSPLIRRALRARHYEEVEHLLRAPMQLGVSTYLVNSAAENYFSNSAEVLAQAEAASEGWLKQLDHNEEISRVEELAAQALFGWALVIEYCVQHFNVPEHPLYRKTLGDLGSNPPWERAISLTTTQDEVLSWMNKFPNQLQRFDLAACPMNPPSRYSPGIATAMTVLSVVPTALSRAVSTTWQYTR